MRTDHAQIKNDFNSIVSEASEIAALIEQNLNDFFSGFERLDKIGCRVKGEQSFLDKTEKKLKNGELKYEVPLKEIQDIIGARVVVYYKDDIERAAEVIKKIYRQVEINHIIPDDVSKFGYEGLHFICFIPNAINPSRKTNPLIPDFFELQIKTLFQHAWSQSEHGLGYKPGHKLSHEEERKLAFIAAQSWGADVMLSEMFNASLLNKQK